MIDYGVKGSTSMTEIVRDEPPMTKTTNEKLAEIERGLEGVTPLPQPTIYQMYTRLDPDTVRQWLAYTRELEVLLALIREEAAKDNAPLGRSDSFALRNIRAALAPLPGDQK